MDRKNDSRQGSRQGGRQGNSQYSDMLVRRIAESAYDIFTPRNIQVARLVMPNDGQLIQDSLALSSICGKLAVRWRVRRGSLGNAGSCGGLGYRQIGKSAYVIFLVMDAGYRIAEVLLPPDGKYLEDSPVLCHICYVLSKRYGLT